MLAIAYFLPWLTGFSLLAWLEQQRYGDINLPRTLGYGFFLGFFICSAILFGAHALTGQLSATLTLILLLALSTPPLLLFFFSKKHHSPTAADTSSVNGKRLVAILLSIMFIHLLLAFYDAWTRPLLPWDAWTTWTYRARIWFLNGNLSPFVSAGDWLTSQDINSYTITAHSYPLTVSLIQLWPALMTGEWNDAQAIFPGFLAGIALILALYGQGRALEWPVLPSLMAAFLFLTLPLVHAHMALPGYADLWLSGFAGLGLVALLHWSVSRDKTQLLTGLLFLFLSLFIKREGILWMLSGLAFISIQLLSWRMLLLLAATIGLAIFTGNSSIQLPDAGRFGYADGAFHLPGIGTYPLQWQDNWQSILKNLFVLSSWNLLFYYCFLAIITTPFTPHGKERKAILSLFIILSSVIVVVFMLSPEGAWATDNTALSRLVLQTAPVLIFMLLLQWQAIFNKSRNLMSSGSLVPLGHPLGQAAILTTVVIAGIISLWFFRTTPVQEQELPVNTSSFHFMLGTGTLQEDTVFIENFSNKQAVISNFQGLKTVERFKYLRFELVPEKLLDDRPLFFWRAYQTGQLHTVALEENIIDLLNLQEQPEWHGDISEFGFIFSQQDGQHWKLSNLVFLSGSKSTFALSGLSDWLEFEPWAQHSAHFIYGGARSGSLSLVLVLGSWTLTTLLFYLLLIKIGKKASNPRQIATVLLLSWILFDTRWLFNLYQQVRMTHDQFAGKTLDEKYGTGIDAEYYHFLSHLKDKLLPSSPQFIQVLGDTKKAASKYFLAKAPWFLAPHNVLNTGQYPYPAFAQKGGYILMLDPPPGLIYDPRQKLLRWGGQQLAATPVYIDPMGALYKIGN